MRQSKLMIAAGSMAAAVFMATPAQAQQAGKHDHESKAKEADESVPPGLAAQGAAVDDKGKLRPLTSDEAKALTEGIRRFVDQSTDGLVQVYHPSGAVSVYLDDRFQSVSLARLAKDGSVATQCVTNMAEAKQFLGQSAKLAPKRSTPAVALEEK